MNWTLKLLPAALGSALLLSSCEGVSSGSSSGTTIYYPTVDQMARLEAEWGMAPREVKPRLREATPMDYYQAATGSAPAPITPAAPAPAAAPAAPAPLAPSQPEIDPATRQKLE